MKFNANTCIQNKLGNYFPVLSLFLLDYKNFMSLRRISLQKNIWKYLYSSFKAKLYFFLLNPVNQLLFASNLLCNLHPINWFATINVHSQALSRPVLLKEPYDKDLFAPKKYSRRQGSYDFTIISRTRIKVGFQ